MDILSSLLEGKIKPYQIEDELKKIRPDFSWSQIVRKATDIRRMYLETKLGIKLENIGAYTTDLGSKHKKTRIEQTIGCVQVPVGFAGPINVKGSYAHGEFFIPIATNEAALIAAVNKGASLLAKCSKNYVSVEIIKDFMTRAPVIKAETLKDGLELKKWIEENFLGIKAEAEKTTKHGKLEKIDVFLVGKYIYPRFYFSTGDAMGMNMVTIATQSALEYIESKNKNIKIVSVSGNVCADKKPTAVNALLGRGKEVHTEISIDKDIVKSMYNVGLERISEIINVKSYLGSARAGTITGFNGHIANIIAGIYLATGQDMAQVVESSTGFVWYEIKDDVIQFGLTLPVLEVGTVGGGTTTETARECLEIMDCFGNNKSKKFAEIVAAAVTVGEFNLYGSLAKGDLAQAHYKFTRSDQNV